MENTLDQSLAAAVATLQATGAPRDEARLDARVLLGAVLGRDRAWLIAHGEDRLTRAQQQRFTQWIERRAAGEPVAYLIGRREFWSLDLDVTSATLIPRPDTETLVSAALARWPTTRPAAVLDLGTGSGAIALALAREHADAQVVGVDISPSALDVARANGVRLSIGNVQWRAGRWFGPLQPHERFDLIVSNPPYIAPDDHHLAEGDVAHEPRRALVAQDHGYADLLHIIRGAPDRLRAGGWLLLEHGHEQHQRVSAALDAAGFSDVTTLCDLAGHPRVTLGRGA